MHSNCCVRRTASMGNAVFATAALAAGTLICEMHEEQFITYTYLVLDAEFKPLVSQRGNKKVPFAMYMACVETMPITTPQRAILKQYIKSLPPKFDNLINWSWRELSLLNNRRLFDKIVAKKRRIVKDIQKFKKRMKNNAVITSLSLGKVFYFYSAIETRCAYFSVRRYDPNSEVGALIPQIDLINHSIYAQCRVELGYFSKSYKVISKRAIEKEEQIFVNYGKYELEEYLEYYGMLPSDQFGDQDSKDSVQTVETHDSERRYLGLREKMAMRYRRHKKE